MGDHGLGVFDVVLYFDFNVLKVVKVILSKMLGVGFFYVNWCLEVGFIFVNGLVLLMSLFV